MTARNGFVIARIMIALAIVAVVMTALHRNISFSAVQGQAGTTHARSTPERGPGTAGAGAATARDTLQHIYSTTKHGVRSSGQNTAATVRSGWTGWGDADPASAVVDAAAVGWNALAEKFRRDADDQPSFSTTTKGVDAGGWSSFRPPSPPTSTASRPNGCFFRGCPAGGPYFYTFTSHRARVPSLRRWLESWANDVMHTTRTNPSPILSGHWRRTRPECFCVTVADFNSETPEDGGVTNASHIQPNIREAVDIWPYDVHIVNVLGPFRRAGGFQELLDAAVTTPLDRSLGFFVDSDMVAFPGLIAEITTHTVLGDSMYAPVCWSTAAPSPHKPWYQGWWRATGTGMLAFWLSDLHDLTGGTLPAVDRTSWGDEDIMLTDMVVSSYSLSLRRACSPHLWHIYHPRFKDWAAPHGTDDDGVESVDFLEDTEGEDTGSSPATRRRLMYVPGDRRRRRQQQQQQQRQSFPRIRGKWVRNRNSESTASRNQGRQQTASGGSRAPQRYFTAADWDAKYMQPPAGEPPNDGQGQDWRLPVPSMTLLTRFLAAKVVERDRICRQGRAWTETKVRKLAHTRSTEGE